jgi:6-pyruvoyltetrahydropterin/6-carboxytetrahydropterin synthase
MITCTRRLEFDAAHRILLHESKCRFLHGHRYCVEATFAAKGAAGGLDALGRVVDFGVIRERLGGWIDAHWDHGTILHAEDRTLGEAIAQATGQSVFYLPCNPTAENLASYLLHEICPALFEEASLRCLRLRLYETPNCYAEAM